MVGTLLRHAVLGVWHSLTRRRLYAVLNIAGLSLGLACFLTLANLVRWQCSFERGVPDADRIARVDMAMHMDGENREYGDVSYVAFDAVRSDCAGVAELVRLRGRSATWQTPEGARFVPVMEADPTFFSVFAETPLSGDPARAFADPSGAVLDAALARQLFGRTDVVGMELTLMLDTGPRRVRIGAVLQDIRGPSGLPFVGHLLVPLVVTPAQGAAPAFTVWGAAQGMMFARLLPGASPAVLATILSAAPGRHPGRKPERAQGTVLVLRFLPSLHFFDGAHELGGEDPRLVWLLGGIGVLALLTAGVNFVNLATAQASLRAREVGLHKVLGASRRVLRTRYVLEAILTALLASLPALALAELARPLVDAWTGWPVPAAYDVLIPATLGVSALTGLVAGVYPAFVLSSFRPVAVLNAGRQPSGGRQGGRVRQVLVAGQCAFAVAMGICTIVMLRQAALIRDADRGFSQSGLIFVQSMGDDALRARQKTLRDALASVPGVTAASLTDMGPHSGSSMMGGVTYASRHILASEATITDGFFGAFHLRLVAGRWLSGADPMDALPYRVSLHDFLKTGTPMRHGDRNVVINQTMARALGVGDVRNAVGLDLNDGYGHARLHIVGVAADARFGDPHEPIGAQVYMMVPGPVDFPIMAVRFEHRPLNAVMADLRKAWTHVAPETPFVARAASEVLAADYDAERRRGRLFLLGAGVAMLIACFGMGGLSAFAASRRMHEMGVRKTLGATRGAVLRLLVWQFVRPVLWANLIAWPVAFVAMGRWLAQYDQRVSLSVLDFVGVSLAALLCCVVTVLAQSLRLANAEPAQALRA